MQAQLSFILSQITRLIETERQTDGQTEFSSQDCACIVCSAVKINYFTALINKYITYEQQCAGVIIQLLQQVHLTSDPH